MPSHVLPDSTSAGFPIALLVCIVVAVTVVGLLMVIALHYYLVRRRRRRRPHRELCNQTPRPVVYIPPPNPKSNPSLQRPPPTLLHSHSLTPPVLPQLRLHSPIPACKPPLTARPKHGVLPPPPVKSSSSTRDHTHLSVPISSFSQPKDGKPRAASQHRNTSDSANMQHHHHRRRREADADADGGSGEREDQQRRPVVNSFFADAVRLRDRESNVQMGCWRASTRERAILASDGSSSSLATRGGIDGEACSPSGEGPESKSPGHGAARHDDGWEEWLGRVSSGDEGEGLKMGKGRLSLKGEWGLHGFVPIPLAVMRREGGRF